jgi:OmpA-OmpF porin, OOP family
LHLRDRFTFDTLTAKTPTVKKLLLPALLATVYLSSTGLQAQTAPQLHALQMTTTLGAMGSVSAWNMDCTSTTSCKKNPGSFRVFASQSVTPNIAVELTYASLGTLNAAAPGTQLSIKGNSTDVSAVYKFGNPDNALGAFVKGGLAYTQTKAEVAVAGGAGSANQNAWGVVLGIGATYALTSNFSLRAEVDTQSVKVPGSKGNVTTMSVGGQGSF